MNVNDDVLKERLIMTKHYYLVLLCFDNIIYGKILNT